jgi:2'-hydroxyisoflavone reductase
VGRGHRHLGLRAAHRDPVAKLLAPAVARYVFVSSISVYREDLEAGAQEGAPVQELADPKTDDVRAHYGALKAA